MKYIDGEKYTWFNTKINKFSEFKYIEGQWSDSDGVLYDYITLSNSGWIMVEKNGS